jgi:hypothetical protein
MSINAHMDQSAAMRPLSHKAPIVLMVALCVVVDIVGIRYVAQNWESLSVYVPYALLALGLCGIAYRVRSVLVKKD